LSTKRVYSERTQVKEILIAGMVPWVIYCVFSIMAIEHANFLMWIFLITAWAYPLTSYIAYKLSKSFYEKEKYSVARLIVWSPVWFPLLNGFLSGVFK
jgi:hypothetical protein